MRFFNITNILYLNLEYVCLMKFKLNRDKRSKYYEMPARIAVLLARRLRVSRFLIACKKRNLTDTRYFAV